MFRRHGVQVEHRLEQIPLFQGGLQGVGHFSIVQRQDAAALSAGPVRAAENSPAQERGRSPSHRPGLMSVALSGGSMENGAPAASLFIDNLRCTTSRTNTRILSNLQGLGGERGLVT